jgi:hypothetical protein
MWITSSAFTDRDHLLIIICLAQALIHGTQKVFHQGF